MNASPLLVEAATHELVAELLNRSSSALVLYVEKSDPAKLVSLGFCGPRLEVVGLASYANRRVGRWMDRGGWPDEARGS